MARAPGSARWLSARSASSTATSGRRRSTRCASASTRRTASIRRRANVLGDPVAHLLVAHARRHREVPDVRHARRQRRGGRHPRAARAGARSAGARAAGSGRRRHARAGLFGAALLYGDGMITPAISVLSAVEGLGGRDAPARAVGRARSRCVILRRPVLGPARGTGSVGQVFGPVMVALVRGPRRARRCHGSRDGPQVLRRSRRTTPSLFFADPRLSRASSCSARSCSCITGGEALYADMGHFGARPIALAWFALVLPALLLNYFGQGALLLADPDARPTNPFFAMVPGWLRVSARGPRDGGDGHRVAGADLGRVLAHAPGGAARATSRA